jgi:uncharacterized OB-fold protein
MTEVIWPRPTIDVWSRPFWEATTQHRLIVQRCSSCAALRYPPEPACGACRSLSFDWQELSGKGTIASWVVFHRGYFDSLSAALPYNVALIHLAEGLSFISNVINIENANLRIGLPVTVVFDDVDAELSIPRFRPLRETEHTPVGTVWEAER